MNLAEAGRDCLEKRRTTVRGRRKKAIEDHGWRWVGDVPVRGGEGALKGTRIEYERTDKENLASILLVLNLLAFAVQVACRLRVKAWQAARKRWGTGRNFFEAFRSFLCRILFRGWDELMQFLASDKGVPASSLGRQLP